MMIIIKKATANHERKEPKMKKTVLVLIWLGYFAVMNGCATIDYRKEVVGNTFVSTHDPVMRIKVNDDFHFDRHMQSKVPAALAMSSPDETSDAYGFESVDSKKYFLIQIKKLKDRNWTYKPVSFLSISNAILEGYEIHNGNEYRYFVFQDFVDDKPVLMKVLVRNASANSVRIALLYLEHMGEDWKSFGTSSHQRSALMNAFLDRCKKVFIINPKSDGMSASDYAKRGNQHRHKREYQKAIRDYDRAIEIDPGTSAGVYLDRGLTWFLQSQVDKAITDYTRAITINPDFALAYNNRGMAYDSKAEYDKAITDYTRAIQIDPNYADAYNNRGCSWDRKGKTEKALADHTTSIELDPEYRLAYSNRGDIWQRKREHDKAISDYSKAIQLGVADARIYKSRGTSLLLRRRYDEAISDFTKAMQMTPADTTVCYNRGVAWFAKSENEKATKDFNRVLSLDDQHANSHYNLGLIWAQKGNRKKAVEHFESYLRITGDTDSKAEKVKTKIKELGFASRQ
jgi:tetratricopeptide (TPR) repeat protein